jgi:hypothetical protein
MPYQRENLPIVPTPTPLLEVPYVFQNNSGIVLQAERLLLSTGYAAPRYVCCTNGIAFVYQTPCRLLTSPCQRCGESCRPMAQTTGIVKGDLLFDPARAHTRPQGQQCRRIRTGGNTIYVL